MPQAIIYIHHSGMINLSTRFPAEKKPNEAAAILRSTANDEDGIEKLPVTPGPIVPARKQLGELLLEQDSTAAASQAFELALTNAPAGVGHCGEPAWPGILTESA